jgi:hypothetical protein
MIADLGGSGECALPPLLAWEIFIREHTAKTKQVVIPAQRSLGIALLRIKKERNEKPLGS